MQGPGRGQGPLRLSCINYCRSKNTSKNRPGVVTQMQRSSVSSSCQDSTDVPNIDTVTTEIEYVTTKEVLAHEGHSGDPVYANTFNSQSVSTERFGRSLAGLLTPYALALHQSVPS